MRRSYPDATPRNPTAARHALHDLGPRVGTHQARTRRSCGWLLPPAHTKRARTIRSGRATYSAQALGRLPWFAPCLRRSRRLRPRFDMSFSLSLLSRLKHFCTHCPKPPRHRSFAATKVTEKRVVDRASSTRESTHVRTPTTRPTRWVIRGAGQRAREQRAPARRSVPSRTR